MSPLVWLLLAVAAAAAAYVVGWSAWSGYRARQSRDLNTERYLQWRGRADRASTTPAHEGMTNDERRRISIGVALAVLAAISLLAFFTTS